MTSPTPEEILRLFNEKVDRQLSRTRSEGWDSVFVGPDEESIEALVLR